jgi:putative acetyltransferase
MTAADPLRLVVPQTPEQIDATREIFREYAQQLGVDLCFQHFESELAELPGEYAPPAGATSTTPTPAR